MVDINISRAKVHHFSELRDILPDFLSENCLFFDYAITRLKHSHLRPIHRRHQRNKHKLSHITDIPDMEY